MENGAAISSNVLKHDAPPILECSTDGIVAKILRLKTPSLPGLATVIHKDWLCCTTFALLGRMHMNMDKRHVTRICVG